MRDSEATKVAKRLRQLAEQAVNVLENILTDSTLPGAVQLNAAKTVLDRTGFGPHINIKGTMAVGELTDTDIEQLKERVKHAGILTGVSTELTHQTEDSDEASDV